MNSTVQANFLKTQERQDTQLSELSFAVKFPVSTGYSICLGIVLQRL